jgi:hypothetical protein
LNGCETWSLILKEELRLGVYGNKVLRRIFGSERDEVTGAWRKLHSEELNVLYCSPYIVRVIKSRRMRWAGHVARKGERRGINRVFMGKPDGKNHLEDPGENERIILKRIFKKWCVRAWNGSSWLNTGAGSGHL